MGLIKLLANFKNTPSEKIDANALKETVYGIKALVAKWQRELDETEKKHKATVSIEALAKLGPVSRKIALQKGVILKRRLATRSAAVNSLVQMQGMLESIIELKEFHKSRTEATKIKGMTMEGLVREAQRVSMEFINQNEKHKEIIGTMTDAMDSGSYGVSEEDKELSDMADKLSALFDELNEKQAMNDTEGVAAVTDKITQMKIAMGVEEA